MSTVNKTDHRKHIDLPKNNVSKLSEKTEVIIHYLLPPFFAEQTFTLLVNKAIEPSTPLEVINAVHPGLEEEEKRA